MVSAGRWRKELLDGLTDGELGVLRLIHKRADIWVLLPCIGVVFLV